MCRIAWITVRLEGIHNQEVLAIRNRLGQVLGVTNPIIAIAVNAGTIPGKGIEAGGYGVARQVFLINRGAEDRMQSCPIAGIENLDTQQFYLVLEVD